MTRLSHHEYDRLLKCVEETYAHQDLEGYAQHVMAICRKLVRSDYAVWDEINLRSKRHTWMASPAEVDLSRPDHAHQYLFTQHPFVLHMQRTGDVPPLRFSDLLTRNQYRETALYREAYQEFGVEYQLGFALTSPAREFFVGLAFNRKHRDFSESDRRVYSLLQPHLLQGYRNAEMITQLRVEAARAEHVLDTLREGAVTVNATGHIHHMTGRTRDWLARYFGVPRGSCQVLPESLLRWFRAQLTGAGNGNGIAAPRAPLTVQHAEGQLTVRLLADSPPGEYLLLMEERRVQDPIVSLRRFGLTAREAEVLSWVAQGKTNSETGIILGLSAGTVHKHLEHIFEKLGVETRTAAAAQALEALQKCAD